MPPGNGAFLGADAMDGFGGAGAGFSGMVDVALEMRVAAAGWKVRQWTSEVMGFLETALDGSMQAGFFAIS